MKEINLRKDRLDMTAIEGVCNAFGNSEDVIRAKKLSLQSTKTHLKKKKNTPENIEALGLVIHNIEVLTQCINYLNPKEKFVTQYNEDDVKNLDYERTMRAIKSIQSAICNNSDNDELFNRYKNIERMLLEHKKDVRPVEEQFIRKTDLQTVVDTVESAPDASRERILEMLYELLNK